MRDQQPDPAHLSAHGHRRGGNQRGSQNEQHPGLFDVDTAGAGFVIAQGEDVQPPAQQVNDSDACKDERAADEDLLVTGTGKAAHQPVGDLRQFVLRVSRILEQRSDCIEQRGGNGSCQHQIDHGAAIVLACNFQGKEDGRKTEHQRNELCFQNAARQNDGQNCAHAGAAGHAKNVRRGKRIRKQGLKGVSRTGQPCTHDDRHKNAGQAQVDDDGIVLHIGCAAAGQSCVQGGQHFPDRDIHTSEAQADHRSDQRQCQHQQKSQRGKAAFFDPDGVLHQYSSISSSSSSVTS